MLLRSDRLVYSEFKSEDFDLFFSVFSNKQVMEYALMDHYTSKEDAYPYFHQILENNKATSNRRAYEYAIYRLCDNQFVGFADIEVSQQNSCGGMGEIGYFFLPPYWGNGYALETTTVLCSYCFTQLGLHRVSARCNVNNKRSEQIMIRSGMTKEGELRKARFKNNSWVNELNYSLLAEEWMNRISI